MLVDTPVPNANKFKACVQYLFVALFLADDWCLQFLGLIFNWKSSSIPLQKY
jgi:hypothetical protein